MLYRRIRDLALSIAKKDGALSDLVRFAYKLCSSEFFDLVLTLLEVIPITIGLEKDWSPWILTVLYCVWAIGLLLSFFAKCYVRENGDRVCALEEEILALKEENQVYVKGHREITSILRGWSNDTYAMEKRLTKYRQTTNIQDNRKMISDVSVRSAALTICENLRNALDIDESDGKVRVRIYEKSVKHKKEICRIIASTNNSDLQTYAKEDPIPQNNAAIKGEDDYHVYLFSKNEVTIEALHGQQSVAEALGREERGMTYESGIQQSIAVPVAAKERGVVLLIRIDSSDPDRFGKDGEALRTFAKAVVYPYGQFLLMVYEQWKVFEKIVK